MFRQLFVIASLQRLGFHLSVIFLGVFLAACGGGGGGGSDAPATATTPPPAATAPIIATAPLPAFATEGQPAIFVVAATGTSPISYQWLRNGQAIPGATSSGYTTPATTLADNGSQFSVRVTNTAGTVTSASAALTVTAALIAPAITVQPLPQIVLVGGQATFSVAITGTAPLSVQWRKNGTAISGATSATYTTPVTALPDSGALFDAVISNASGTVTSTAALLTVNPLPLAAAPQGVESGLMNYLVSLGTGFYSGSRNEGPQYMPAQGAALITASSSGPANAVPTTYNASFELQNFDHNQYYSPLSVAAQTLILNAHTAGVIQGQNLDRYDSAKYVDYGSGYFGLLVSDVVIGIRSNFNEVGIGNWKFIGPGQSGYFSGFQAVRGSFIVGQPTPDSATSGITSSAYAGFAHGATEFEGGSLYAFNEFAAQAAANYDSAAHTVTISLQGFSGYFGGISFNTSGQTVSFTSNWPVIYALPATPAFSIPLSCVAAVNPTMNTFSCSLTNPSSSITGVFNGKFYGAHGAEMAGTFVVNGLVGGGGFFDGVVGAVALKR